MLNPLLDNESLFIQKKHELAIFLRTLFSEARELSRAEIKFYNAHDFVAGWSISVSQQGKDINFHLLIDAGFPYSIIRVAYKSHDVYLKWPHVENQGVFCLPKPTIPSEDLESSTKDVIVSALDLIKECQVSSFVEDELRREFLSYWYRALDKDTKPIRSLLNVDDRSTRKVMAWHGRLYTLIGESEEQIINWLSNLLNKKKDDIKVSPAIFSMVYTPPIPPYPVTANEFLSYLDFASPEVIKLIKCMSNIEPSVSLVLGFQSANGVGLFGCTFVEESTKGFRRNGRANGNVTRCRLAFRYRLKKQKVVRVESSWVHGRDQDAYHSTLRKSNILVIGCGSVGSQVAIRLAQAGIGSMTLLDPECLESANVGRHALGMDSFGKSKAQELSSVLRKRFPHMIKAHGDKKRWQDYLAENHSMLNNFDLIIACLGEWSEEALLNEWHRRSKSCTPIVYGWLDERGTAAHAVALTGEGVSLNCIIEGDTLRTHETIWDNSENSAYAEPACGNLFQPYGAVDVLYAEGLVTKLCLDILLSNVKVPKHRVYAGSTENLQRLGGQWSPEHLKYRPQNYDGSFEYERNIESCGQCRDCKGGS